MPTAECRYTAALLHMRRVSPLAPEVPDPCAPPARLGTATGNDTVVVCDGDRCHLERPSTAATLASTPAVPDATAAAVSPKRPTGPAHASDLARPPIDVDSAVRVAADPPAPGALDLPRDPFSPCEAEYTSG
jgi:hypothetical protein